MFDFLLIPHFYEYDYFIGIISFFSKFFIKKKLDKEVEYRKKYSKLYFKIIDVLNDPYDQIVTDIILNKRVISSSLTGIIVSESYGIPAIFIRPSDRYLSILKF